MARRKQFRTSMLCKSLEKNVACEAACTHFTKYANAEAPTRGLCELNKISNKTARKVMMID
jgi:hypothetical protein